MTRTVTYDAFGNETSDLGPQVGSASFGYSSRELLSSDSTFTSSNYYYNGFRQRVATSTSGLSLDSFFDRLHLIAETSLSATPSVAYKYIWFGDRPAAQVDSTGTHWTFADHLGTPIIQTDATPTVAWQAEYEPYGRIWALRTGNNLYQPLRFPGQTAEQLGPANNQTGRYFNNSRWYRSAWGRYTQADSFLTASSPTNGYAYVDDDPIRETDPMGLCKKDILCHRVPQAPVFWHCFVVFHDTESGLNDGAGFAVAGEPEHDPTLGWNGLDWGQLVVVAKTWNRAFPGWDNWRAQSNKPWPIKRVLDDNVPCATYICQAMKRAKYINHAKIPYAADPGEGFANSNSVAQDQTNSPQDNPAPFPGTPGWNVPLPYPR